MISKAEKYQPLIDDKTAKSNVVVVPATGVNTQAAPIFARVSAKYDSYRTPADHQKAEAHYLATRIAQPVAPKSQAQIDEASGLPTTNKQLGLCCGIKELSFLSPGYPMYFQFIRFCMVIGFIMLLTSGIFNIRTYSKGYACSLLENSTGAHSVQGAETVHPQNDTAAAHREGFNDIITSCPNNFVNHYSLANKLGEDFDLEKSDIYNFFTIIVLLIVMQVIRKVQKQTAQVIDERAITASDFTAYVKNLPRDFPNNTDIDEQIKEFFVAKAIPNRRANVQNVSVCYDVSDQIAMKKKVRTLIANKAKLQARKRNNQLVSDDEISQLERDIESYKRQLQANSDRYRDGVGVAKSFEGEAYVTFETQEELQLCLRHWKLSWLQRLGQSFGKTSVYQFRNKVPRVIQAPEPSDVYWENAGVSNSAKFFLRLTTNLITLFLLGLGFVGVLAITKKKTDVLHQMENDTDSQDVVLSVYVKVVSAGASVFIVVLNLILKSVLFNLTKLEKYSTHTEFLSSYAIKSTIAQFLNTSIITFVVSLLFKNIYGPGGLTYTAFLIFVSNNIITWGFTLLNPTYITHMLKKSKVKKVPEPLITQDELNTIYRLPEFDFAYKAASYGKTILSAAFFAPLIPIVVPVALIGIIVDYGLDKYVMLRRTSRGFDLGPQLAFTFVEFLEYCMVAFSFGNFAFNMFVVNSDIREEWLALLGLIIGIINAFAPMDSINEWLFPGRDENLTADRYSDVKYTFHDDYDRKNPATRDSAREAFNQGKQARGI